LKAITFLAATGLIISSLSTAQAESSASACTAIDEDLARLACYDRALGKAPTADASPVSHWNIRSTKSDFTDQTDVYISTQAEKPLQCSYRHTPVLYVRCLEGKTNVFISHGCYAPPDRDTKLIDVQLRLDDEPTIKESLYTTTDDKGFGWWEFNSAMGAVRNRLLDHDTLVIRFSPYREAPQIARFKISGLREAMATTEPSCVWGDLEKQN